MLELDGQRLSLQQINAVARGEAQVGLSAAARLRAEEARRIVERIVAEGRTVYGVNTGFGKLSDVHIDATQLQDLQLNLVRSHSCGLGPALSDGEARALVLLRANVLANGFSGCRAVLIEALIALLERGVTPVIPEKGSVGASGDLAPLAHLALALIGEGEAFFKGERLPAAEALSRAGLAPVKLEVKEGLALLNGTQAMAAVGALALHRAQRLVRLADVAGAMTLEALRGTPVPFDDRIHQARPHAGQISVAAHLRDLLRDSEIRQSHLTNDPRVQDAYSLRCMPQVHGAVRGALAHATEIVEIESGSATDNPLVFADTGELLSGGNFHGAPLALAFDYAAMAVTDLMSISERRIDRLVNPDANDDLPPFLTSQPGMSSGFMMMQVTAVALLNEAKVFAHPASIDNVPTDGGKEDHVSMGMTAATKLRAIVDNAEMVAAIELISAAEGLEYRAPLKPGRGVRQAYEIVRAHVKRLTNDRPLAPDIERIVEAIRGGEFDALAYRQARHHTAIHEAGHTVVGYLLGRRVMYAVLFDDRRGEVMHQGAGCDTCGKYYKNEASKDDVHCKHIEDDLRRDIAIALAGEIAEIDICGEHQISESELQQDQAIAKDRASVIHYRRNKTCRLRLFSEPCSVCEKYLMSFRQAVEQLVSEPEIKSSIEAFAGLLESKNHQRIGEITINRLFETQGLSQGSAFHLLPSE